MAVPRRGPLRVEMLQRTGGPGLISHLPISMDGSCNGYQHLSAMGLDPIGGRATNLMPFRETRQGEASNVEPQDIYQWVSDLVCRGMGNRCCPGKRQRSAREKGGQRTRGAARQLLPIMDRELAKECNHDDSLR